MEQSPFELMRKLTVQLGGVLSPIDMHAMPQDTQKAALPIRQQLIDARLEVRDYELAETRAEQRKAAEGAKERLETLQQSILAASELGIFSAADVAQFSAQIQQIISLLQ